MDWRQLIPRWVGAVSGHVVVVGKEDRRGYGVPLAARGSRLD
jgi:hypothetical protein